MAASILKCGKNRIWMDPDRTEEIAKAVTREDMAILINGGAINSMQKQGISNGRRKYALNQRKKGRRTGHVAKRCEVRASPTQRTLDQDNPTHQNLPETTAG